MELIMKELNMTEVEFVSGAGLMKSIGFAVGWTMGAGAAMQQRINNMDNFMLGAMQYGA